MPANLKLTFFGTAAGFPTKARPHTSSVGLWAEGSLYLFDVGDGIAGQFARMDVAPEALRAIFLTHFHADHVAGLPVLLQWLELNQRAASLPVYVPDASLPGLRDMLHLLYLYPMDVAEFELILLPARAGFAHEVDDLLVTPIPSQHLERGEASRAQRGARAESQAFSYLIEVDGKRVYLSGDVAVPQEAARHAANADLAIVELAHFSPEELGEAMRALTCPRLALYHIKDTFEPLESQLPDLIRSAGFGGEVYVAHDGDELVL